MVEDFPEVRRERCLAQVFAHTPKEHPEERTELATICGERLLSMTTSEHDLGQLKRLASRMALGFCVNCPNRIEA